MRVLPIRTSLTWRHREAVEGVAVAQADQAVGAVSSQNRPTIDAVVKRATKLAIDACIAQGVVKFGQFPDEHQLQLMSIGMLAAVQALTEIADEQKADSS